MEEAKKYKEKYEENQDEETIPNLVQESHIDNQMDEGNLPFGFEDSEEEKDDYKILRDDNIFVCGKIEDEFAALETYIYEKKTGNMYVHHDIMLPSFPLALDWLPIEPSSLEANECSKGNYAIVGTFYPDIEIWSLDTLDAIEPALVLSGVDSNPLM